MFSFSNSLQISVNCEFDEWEEWTQCTTSCNGGTRFRTRGIKVAAVHGGAECEGDSKEEETCNDQLCPGTWKLQLRINASKKSFLLIPSKHKCFVSITTIGDCPPGYAVREGDLPGWGDSDIGSALDLSLEDCADRCNGETTCLSFEHSPTQMKCNLNKIAEPSGGPYSDFIFCTKIGNC